VGESLLERVGGALTGVAVRLPRADPRPQIVGTRFLSGTTERGRPVAATAGGFLQANLHAAERLADELVRLTGIGGARRCIELYAGTGLLGWRLAEQGADVRAYELDGDSVAAARALPAPPRGALAIDRADAADALRLADVGATDVVVADPPRSGLGPVAPLLVERRPRRVVLVSCSTRSLGKDVGCLVRAGYRVREAVAIDLFPQTRHVESLVRLDA
jgi:23S rRNA (uracil1939-C5)-methyltransferase